MRARLYDNMAALVWTLMLGSARKRHRCPCGCLPSPPWLTRKRLEDVVRLSRQCDADYRAASEVADKPVFTRWPTIPPSAP